MFVEARSSIFDYFTDYRVHLPEVRFPVAPLYAKDVITDVD